MAERSNWADRALSNLFPPGDGPWKLTLRTGEPDELARRAAVYGTCETCGFPRDVKAATDGEGGTHVRLYCPACGEGDP